MKNFFLLIISILIISSCNNQKEFVTYDGFIQGTTFHIVFEKNKNISNNNIDSIFKDFDNAFSLYDTTSLLTKINNNETNIINPLFANMLKQSKEVFSLTNGAFDITVGPIVNAWGFGSTDTLNVDSNIVDSLLNFVGLNKISLENNKITKQNKNTKLDFNAIAQGYTSDIIADFFDLNNLDNYLIEVGGEIRAKGKNHKNQLWKVGIDKPTDNSSFDNRELQEIVKLDNKSLATSGNYRKFYLKDGVRISHTINPKTGYPVKHSLLSVTVLANTASKADAFATSFMVVGVNESLKIIENNPELEAYFISSDKNGKLIVNITKGFEKMIYLKDSI